MNKQVFYYSLTENQKEKEKNSQMSQTSGHMERSHLRVKLRSVNKATNIKYT